VNDSVLLSNPVPGVTLVTLNRPERLNAMHTDLVQSLHNALNVIDIDPACRVVILTGAGDAFCAGLDLTGYGVPPTVPPGESGSVQRSMATQKHIASLIPRLREIRQPIIAAVNGAAAGGGLALVLGSDIRIGTTSARFAVSFVKVGISACDIGTSWLLPKIVGVGRAHELMLTGRTIGSTEAADIGLILEVVPPDELLERCLAVATLIMQNSPYGVWMTKETMWAALEIPGLAAAIAMENRTQVMSLQTGDFLEAADAFLTKRSPRWAPPA
jgi:enoyl-CoA hydratase